MAFVQVYEILRFFQTFCALKSPFLKKYADFFVHNIQKTALFSTFDKNDFSKKFQKNVDFPIYI
jgi:hypothetical protein